MRIILILTNVLKPYIKLLSELSSIKLFLIRYFVNFILFIELLLLPVLLMPNEYVKLEFLKNLFLISPLLLFGIHTGYINYKYRKECDYRFELLFGTFIFSILAFMVFYIFFQNFLFASSAFSMMMALSIEKILIVDGHLILASMYKIVFSVVLVFLILVLNSETIDFLYPLSINIGFLLFLILLITKYKFYYLIKSDSLMLKIKELIKEGFYISIQSFILIGYFLFDRWFFITYYNDHITEYSISFSFSQIVFIALNTIAFSMQKQLGENLASCTKASLKRLLKINFIFFIVLWLFSLIIVYGIIRYKFFNQYGDFLNSYIVISFFYGLFYLFSTYNIIGLYRGKAFFLFLWIALTFIINIILSYIFYILNADYYLMLLKSGLILVFLASYSYNHIFKSLYDK